MSRRTFSNLFLGIILSIAFASMPMAATTSADAKLGSAHRLNAEGIDTCTKYSASTWNQVFTGSDEWALGFYLGGSTAQTNNCYIGTQTWLANLSGWWTLPIYDSLQAPCGGYQNEFSSDPTTAHSQGKTIADHAANKANQDGFSTGSVIYLDIEAFSGGTTCMKAAKNFVGGWTQELHSRGHVAGVYGSDCASHMDMYATIPNAPDDAWIANWNNVDSADRYGSQLLCVSPDHWINNHRIHQYNHDRDRTLGGQTVHVDSDCVNGAANGAYYDATCG
ncbi:MAG TPA: glycoside hydrolase domain-containing protein [Nocardioidaceae bacterium]|nr:glycoside hydrolase domain-containing protein [Nocardioidaceae bacterium]